MAAIVLKTKFLALWAWKEAEELNFLSCIYENCYMPGRVKVLSLFYYLHSLLEMEYWIIFYPRHLSRKGTAGSSANSVIWSWII